METEPLWSVTTCISQVKVDIFIRAVNSSNARQQSCESQENSEEQILLRACFSLLNANAKENFTSSKTIS